jgi:formate hydrogenlyase subunit 3/multisubunit Na+/H+ antiporter MnhD subunit
MLGICGNVFIFLAALIIIQQRGSLMVDSVPVFPLMRTFGGLIIMIVIGVAGAITGALFPVETRRKLSKHSIQTLHE